MKRRGMTLIEILVVIAIGLVLFIFIGGICLGIKGCNYVVNTVETSVADNEALTAEKMVSNPPKYKAGDIVYHKASDKKLIVAENACSWNKVQEGWNMKVKDGGNWDKVGGYSINEAEVKPSLE